MFLLLPLLLERVGVREGTSEAEGVIVYSPVGTKERKCQPKLPTETLGDKIIQYQPEENRDSPKNGIVFRTVSIC